MLFPSIPRRYLTLALLVVFVILVVGFYRGPEVYDGSLALPDWMHKSGHGQPSLEPEQPTSSEQEQSKSSDQGQSNSLHQRLEIFSQSSSDRKYFNLKFGKQEATNANIIPSAVREDAWVIVAVKQRSQVPNSLWFAELECEAQFVDGVLQCLEEPMILPIASTHSDKCTGDHFGFWGLNVGPHDGRVFYGPEHPYMIFGSNSQYNCFGLWMQDFRMLVDWGKPVWPDEYFRLPTDLQRPQGMPHNPVEKNWFAFWDKDNAMYIHHDIVPHRVFAEIQKNGSAGPDLGLEIQGHDEKCMKSYLPALPEGDSDNAFHQATNSLSITMCKRADPFCQRSDNNTFILNIIQHKMFRDGHAEYDPYLFLFQDAKPFKIAAINPRPLWISGREEVPTPEQTTVHTTMFYVTSISWKNHSQTYHGYLDDIMFLAFGIEDERPAAIDVLASDLLEGLMTCDGFEFQHP